MRRLTLGTSVLAISVFVSAGIWSEERFSSVEIIGGTPGNVEIAPTDQTAIPSSGPLMTSTDSTIVSLPGLPDTAAPLFAATCEFHELPFFGPCHSLTPSLSGKIFGVPPLRTPAPPYFGERVPEMPSNHFTSPVSPEKR